MAWRRAGLMLCAALAGGLTALAPWSRRCRRGVCPVGGGGRLAEAAVPVRGGGNVLAWALVLLVSCLPLLLLVLPRGRGALAWGGPAAAWVRPAVSGFGLLFGQPHLAAVPIFPEVWMLAAFGIWGMGLVSWLVLRLLRGLEEGRHGKRCLRCSGFCWWAAPPCWYLPPRSMGAGR